jgi:iron complex transport system substrate-binding protein
VTRFLALALLATPVAAQDFPVTIEHERGTITLEEAPERVVVVGVHEQDFLYALGIAPVGVHEWWGEHPYATWPWAEEARIAVGAEPEVLPGWEINAEWVAALEPDLIVATYFGDFTDADYEVLSQIAPVLLPPPGTPQWGLAWQDELRLLGRATGTSERAEEIAAEIEARFAEARAAYPQFEGLTASTGYWYEGNVQVFNSADTANRFLQQFGFVTPPAYDELATERGGLDVSPENFELIDLDLLVLGSDLAATQQLLDLSVWQELDVAKEGRAILLGDSVLAAALSFQTPLALGYLIDELGPRMALAVDGDPATVVPAAE